MTAEDYAVERLSHVPGLLVTRPEASYLLWMDAAHALPVGADNAAQHLLAHGVGVSDGSTFGGAPSTFRINVACKRSTLERGLGRIVEALQTSK